MAIVAGDIDFHHSGGSGNSNPNADLGGARATAQITDATLHNLFDKVTGSESTPGDTEYRCLYVRNAHGSLTLEGAEAYIQTNTPSADSTIEIGLDPAGVNGTATTIANESAAPAGVTFSAPGSGAPLAIGDIPTGQHQAIWVKRVISAGAAAVDSDAAIIRVQGDTAA